MGLKTENVNDSNLFNVAVSSSKLPVVEAVFGGDVGVSERLTLIAFPLRFPCISLDFSLLFPCVLVVLLILNR